MDDEIDVEELGPGEAAGAAVAERLRREAVLKVGDDAVFVGRTAEPGKRWRVWHVDERGVWLANPSGGRLWEYQVYPVAPCRLRRVSK